MYICTYGRMKALHCTVERTLAAHRWSTQLVHVQTRSRAREMTSQGPHGMAVMKCDGSEQHLLGPYFSDLP